MASGQTTHYGLNQWQPEDAVLRTDFNADNAKTDTALNNLQQLIGTKEAALAAAIAGCYSPSNPYLTSGTYVGTCFDTSSKFPVTIELGFRPSMLVVLDSTQGDDEYEYGLLVGNDKGYFILRKNGKAEYESGLSFTGTGFIMNVYDDPDYNFNVVGHTYWYFALR